MEFKNVREEMRAEFAKVNSELQGIKSTAQRTAVKVANLEGELSDVRRDMATKQQVAYQERRLYFFMREVQTAMNLKMWADKSFDRHEGRLDGHERRLSKLEARRA
jgi:hypothetical protein